MSAALAYVALGSNLGDRAAHLAAARDALSLLPGTRLAAVSRVEETSPLGGMDQPPYLNQMVLLATDLAPLALLAEAHRIEAAEGRVRGAPWGSRTLDIDIVRYDDLVIDTPELVLPHPGLASRDFWQREIGELEAHVR